MAGNKTIPTTASVSTFLDSVPDEKRRRDALSLLPIFQKASGEHGTMWGTSIVGFGTYHYRYDSGREGDFLRIGFSPRKQNMSLYLYASQKVLQEEGHALGKYSTGKSCLYIKKLEDVDLEVLARILARSYELSKLKYPTDT